MPLIELKLLNFLLKLAKALLIPPSPSIALYTIATLLSINIEQVDDPFPFYSSISDPQKCLLDISLPNGLLSVMERGLRDEIFCFIEFGQPLHRLVLYLELIAGSLVEASSLSLIHI